VQRLRRHGYVVAAFVADEVLRLRHDPLALDSTHECRADRAGEHRVLAVSVVRAPERYARTSDWLAIIDAAWKEATVMQKGQYYSVEELIVAPKPSASTRGPRPTIYAGGESPKAKDVITRQCDAYVMHGDPVDRIAPKIADMRARREALGLPPMQYGMAAYAIVRDTEAEAQRELQRITNVNPGSPGYQNYQDWIANTRLEQQVTLEDYSVSNRGLRAGLVGTAGQVAERVRAFSEAGVDLLLLQCSPQLEEMEPLRGDRHPALDRGCTHRMTLSACCHGSHKCLRIGRSQCLR